MRKRDHSVVFAFESFVDVLLNVIAIIAAYTTVLVFEEAVIGINSFKSLLGIMTTLLASEIGRAHV